MAKEQRPLYEGKAKQLFTGPEKGHYVMRFKDSATAFNNKKKAEIERKGLLNLKISAKMFEYLREHGVDSHFVRTINEREMLVKAVTIVPLEVVVRNIAAGSLCKRLGVAEKTKIDPPLVEFFYKSDPLDDPLLTEDHIRMLKIATDREVAELKMKALQVNDLLRKYFEKLGILLVDFKIEFGRDNQGSLLLADEITPDGCRLWDAKTMEILDKDRFRKDLGGLVEAYDLVWDRMQKGHA
ncbi:MAG TPA: phosphoribosylaminoimidazolesuccinocarboxamide synthase [Bdellovibrionota bacterium]|nr:phosphoribosylaminoimidazolesuccinocarboxamide synthase [Bdellovibrionota bacterium]